MATIINNPDSGNNSSGMGLTVGVVVAVVLIFLFFYYGLPAIRGTNNQGTTINVPDKINVNVNKQQ